MSKALGDVWVIYRRELRAALRERSIVINSIIVPLVLYPLLLWAVFSLLMLVKGREEQFVSRLAIAGLPDGHLALRAELEEEGIAELVDTRTDGARQAIVDGELDAYIEILEAEPEAAVLEGNFRVRVTFDGSKDRSLKARSRVESKLAEYREMWTRDRAAELGVDEDTWRQFDIERRNVASGDEMGAFLLGLMAPLLMVIMIAVGCFYPAVDSTAGERERSTWETSLSLPCSRSSLLLAKYLYVATLGCTAGLLNLLAMSLSMRLVLSPLLRSDDGADLSFQVPMTAIPLMVAASVLLALFIAAGMMVFASFARTFKEGQSMIGPFYLLCLLPPLFVQSPDLQLTFGWALVPVANVTLLFRSAISGSADLMLVVVTLVVEAATIAALLVAARFVLGFEEVMVGSFEGGLAKFVKARVKRAGRNHANGESR